MEWMNNMHWNTINEKLIAFIKNTLYYIAHKSIFNSKHKCKKNSYDDSNLRSKPIYYIGWMRCQAQTQDPKIKHLKVFTVFADDLKLQRWLDIMFVQLASLHGKFFPLTPINICSPHTSFLLTLRSICFVSH